MVLAPAREERGKLPCSLLAHSLRQKLFAFRSYFKPPPEISSLAAHLLAMLHSAKIPLTNKSVRAEDIQAVPVFPRPILRHMGNLRDVLGSTQDLIAASNGT